MWLGILLATLSVASALHALQHRPYHSYSGANDHHTPMQVPMTHKSFQLLGVNATTGFVRVRDNGAGQFFWFWESIHGNVHTDSRPLVLWLQGGPGCSGQEADFWEFGPVAISQNVEPVRRNGTWAEYFHLLFIDNPLGAGYSFVTHPDDLSRTEEQISSDMYTTLQKLIKTFPAWFNREFYIVGHSYSGHYIPVLATEILERNKLAGTNEDVFIPLSGIAIGDGWTDPAVQISTYASYGRTVGILGEQQAKVIEEMQNTTSRLAWEGRYVESNNWLNYMRGNATKFAGGINICNYRDYSGYNVSLEIQWLNRKSTKELLGVPLDLDWVDCSATAENALNGDIMVSYSHLYPALLKELKVMLYNGQDDFLVDTLGSFLWFDQLDWYGRAEFHKSRRILWYHKESPAGYVQRFQRFTRVLVNKAGHLVHHDQLLNGRDMLRRFVFNLPWTKRI